jgi:NADH:ubiquinone oxidoreductase subunit
MAVTDVIGSMGRDLTDAHKPEATIRGGPNVSVNMSLEREMRTVSEIKNLFYRAREKRKSLTTRWVDSYNIMEPNNMWPNRAGWMPHPEVPEIYPIVATISAWETDNRPNFTVAPAAEAFTPYYEFYDTLAHDLTTVLQATWQLEDYDAEIEKVVYDGNLYGIGWFKCIWNQNAQGGLGNAQLTRADPFTIYHDPDARSDTDMTYILEVKTMAAQDLEERFPGSLARIGTHGLYEEQSDEAPTTLDSFQLRGHMPKANPAAIAPATSTAYGLPGQTDRLSPVDEPGVTVIEAWLRTIISDNNRRYVGWRCVVVAGNRVVMDEPAENLWSHGQHPYERYVPHDRGEMYAPSLVELLTPMQVSLNRMLAAMEHNIWLVGNPVFKEDVRAGLMRTKITNKPGQRITVNSPNSVAEWLNPPQLHPQLNINLLEFYISQMERVSGLSAVVRGATPTGRNAQGVIDAVQEAAFVRIRMSLRNLQRSLRRAGNKLASMIVEYYDTPRIVAQVGPSGEKTSLTLRNNHFYMPSDKGRLPMKFQLLVDTGAETPMSQSQRAQEADVLYGMGAIDEEALLVAHNWPNRIQVVQRVRAQKQAAGELGQAPGARQRTRS